MTGSERRKVLVLIDALRPGGAERAAMNLAMSMPHDRYDVTLCTTRRHDGVLAEELEGAGVTHVTLDRSGRFDLLPLLRLFRLLRRERFDVLHAHKFGSNAWGSVIGRLARVPVVIAHEHSWSYEGQPVRRFVDRRVIGRLADVFVAVSSRDRERMTSVEGVPAGKTAFIPNAFVPAAEAGSDGDLRQELGLSPDAPVVGIVSVLRAEKALDVLLDAIQLVSRRVPAVQLVVAGYGPMAEPWQEHAESLGIGDRVHWLGMRRDVPVVLRALDVAAMSSDREGMPIFALECMAERVPFVATDVGGLRDVFDSSSAVLVPPRSPSELADALEELLVSPERRRALAEAAHARMADFSMDRAVERIGALYESVLSGERGRRR